MTPSIALRTLAAALLVLPLGACLPLDGKADRAMTASEAKPTSLTINSRFCDVELSLATGETVSVDAKVHLETSGGNATAEREIEFVAVQVVREGDTLIIRQGPVGGDPSKPWSFSGSSAGSGVIRVALPAGVPFVIKAASGDVTCNGDFGDIAATINTASGDIKTTLGAKSLSAEAASGDSTLKFLRPLQRLQWRGASGSLDAKGVIAKADLNGASGDIVVDGLTGSCDASAASGSIRLVFSAFTAESVVSASAASGDIVIVLPADANPSGTMRTASGSMSAPMPMTTSRGTATLSGTIGTIKASAASGDVTIKKQG